LPLCFRLFNLSIDFRFTEITRTLKNVFLFAFFVTILLLLNGLPIWDLISIARWLNLFYYIVSLVEAIHRYRSKPSTLHGQLLSVHMAVFGTMNFVGVQLALWKMVSSNPFMDVSWQMIGLLLASRVELALTGLIGCCPNFKYESQQRHHDNKSLSINENIICIFLAFMDIACIVSIAGDMEYYRFRFLIPAFCMGKIVVMSFVYRKTIDIEFYRNASNKQISRIKACCECECFSYDSEEAN
jgi:hypothetical protein